MHLCRSSRQPQLVSRVRLSSSITRVRCWVRTSLRRCRCTTLDLIKAPPSPCCGATAPAKKWCKTPRFRFDCSESSLRTAMTGQCSLEPLSLSLSFSLSHALSLSLSLSLSRSSSPSLFLSAGAGSFFPWPYVSTLQQRDSRESDLHRDCCGCENPFAFKVYKD